MPKNKKARHLLPREEWTYEVPGNWIWMQMGEVYAINPKNSVDDDLMASFIPMEKITAGMVSEYTYDIQSWKTIKKGHTQFADGDVAFAKISPCFENRKSMILNDLVNGIGAGTTELIVLRQPHINNKYTFWFISNEEFIRGGTHTYSGTVGQQRISLAYVKSYPVPIPPFPEQQRIVSRIESLFTKLNAAEERIKDALEKSDRFRTSVLHLAFTGELTKKWREEHDVRMESWKECLWDELVDRMQNGLSKRNGNSGIEYAVLRLADLHNNVLDIANARKILLDERERLNYSLNENDVIMIRVNGSKDNVGKQFLVLEPSNCAFCDHLIRIQFTKEVMPSYMIYFSMTKMYKIYILDNMVSSAGQNTISRRGMSKLKVPIPTLPEQQEIVRILDTMFDSQMRVKEITEQNLSRIARMKKSLLSLAFRGQLGTNNPAEESMESVLLTSS